MSNEAKFTTAEAARGFMLGGNATVTLVSLKTGTRFTYKIRQADSGDVWFVSLLSGPDNEKDFSYLGRIDASLRFWRGRKTPKPGDVGIEAPSMKAFSWTWQGVMAGHNETQVEIWHEGRCGRCNRKLTVPASIASGFGPECVKMECV